jgi:hypothetical protein
MFDVEKEKAAGAMTNYRTPTAVVARMMASEQQPTCSRLWKMDSSDFHTFIFWKRCPSDNVATRHHAQHGLRRDSAPPLRSPKESGSAYRHAPDFKKRMPKS